VPPGRLHAIPWALLPSLSGRVHEIAPSARAWLRARRLVPPVEEAVVLVRGPGLSAEGDEVPAIAELYDRPGVLRDGAATAERVLDAIDGCTLAHLSAHGTFRADSPLFSALRMVDGPLTAYDFERLRRAPYRLVLPCCDSARLASAAAGDDPATRAGVWSLVALGAA
jgi:CHAT domain-containing protein